MQRTATEADITRQDGWKREASKSMAAEYYLYIRRKRDVELITRFPFYIIRSNSLYLVCHLDPLSPAFYFKVGGKIQYFSL